MVTRVVFPLFFLFSGMAVFAEDETSTADRAMLVELVLPINGKTVLPTIRALDGIVAELKTAKEKAEHALSTASGGVASGDVAPGGENAPEPDETVVSMPPTVVLQFTVEPDQEAYGRGSTFGACYELADHLAGETFAGIRTVAFFPQSVRGHALLPALACDELIVAEAARIGEAGVDETTITPTVRQGYLEIATRHRRFPAAIVEKLLDRNVELLRVETEKGTRWSTPGEIESLRKTESFASEPETVLAAGQPGLFSGSEARKNRMADFLADDLPGLARGLGLRPDQVRPASLVGRHGHAVRVDLVGPVTAAKTGEIARQIKAAIDGDRTMVRRQGPGDGRPVDFICLVIDSAGGKLEESLALASFLAKDIDSKKVRTVAYVPNEARSDAALIALACDEVVLAPNAVLGGDGNVVFGNEELDLAKPTITGFFARESVRGWSLPLGMVDPRVEIHKMSRAGPRPVVDYFCEEERREQPDADRWIKGDLVKKEGRLFQTDGIKGQSMRLVDRTATDFAQFKTLYGLENDPMLLEPGWADVLVRALATPGMAMLLLFLGITGIWGEMKNPGIGVGIVLAVVCFALFFWSRFLGGTVGWLELMLFGIGFVFLAIEIFVLPGFGLFGITGVFAIIVSVVLASQTFIIPRNAYQLAQMQSSLLILLVAGVGVTVLGFTAAKYLHEANKPKDDEQVAESEKLADYAHLLGAVGVAFTLLVPAGKARFGDEILSVVSDGDVVEPGCDVEVIDVQGYRIVVRRR